MGIAVDTDVRQANKVAVDAGLLEKARVTVVRGGVEAGLAGQDHDGYALEVDELPRRLFLQKAWDEVRAVRFLLLHEGELGRIGDLRGVTERDIADAPCFVG